MRLLDQELIMAFGAYPNPAVGVADRVRRASVSIQFPPAYQASFTWPTLGNKPEIRFMGRIGVKANVRSSQIDQHVKRLPFTLSPGKFHELLYSLFNVVQIPWLAMH